MTHCGDKSLLVYWRILLQQRVAKNQIRQNLCDLLQQHNSVAETKIFTKISPVHTKQVVALMYRRNMLLQLVVGPVHME